MRKVIASCIVSFFVLISLIVLANSIFAQEQKPEIQSMSSVVIFGGLKLKEGADPTKAELLFHDQLLPAIRNIKGVRMRVIKKMPLPNEKEDANSYDYLMMAEVDDPMTLMQLMQSQNIDPKLRDFGKMMKEFAEEPSFKAFTVIGDTNITQNQEE